MRIKICGLSHPHNIRSLIPLAPDYMGFIFYKYSPRDVSAFYKELPLCEIPSGISKVAVCVDMPLAECVDLMTNGSFDVVQLHGNESPDYCQKLKEVAKVTKSFAVADSLPGGLKDYADVCDFFLFDASGPLKGGNGSVFNHSLLETYQGPLPYFLAGGLGLSHTSFFKEPTLPFLHALDLNSGFESSPGIKDVNRICEFMKNKKSYESNSRQ
jgi:phosphoribosylanthranilate isomerase